MIVCSVKEPSCEDTEQEFEERVSRSVLSAVDLEQIQHTFPMVRIYCVRVNQMSNPNVCARLSRRTTGNYCDCLKRPHSRK